MQIPMARPDITAAEIEAVKGVLETDCLSIGPRIVDFEEGLGSFVEAPYAVGVSSGTAGLHLSVIASGVGEGDLVITTPFSFVASANVILYERAIPVFVDIDPCSLNIDPAQIAEAVDAIGRSQPAAAHWLPPSVRSSKPDLRNLKAILAVHVFGQPSDMDLILDVAGRYELAVIEDACEAIGAEYKGRKVGSLGDSGVFAFYPNKQITAGEGGMIVTHREDWSRIFRSLRNQGRDIFDPWLHHDRLGYNYRMDEMSAALALAQLRRIQELLARREQVASWYNQRLVKLEGVQIPVIAPTTTRVSWFVYVVRLAPGIDRKKLMVILEDKGIPSRPYFTPIHLQPFYQRRFGFREGDFPVAEAVARTTLALPFFGTMNEEQVDYVCGQIVRAVGTLRD